MKKDKFDIKSSLQSWLIALICCIVVICATVCGIVFGSVPMHVALADVASWTEFSYYSADTNGESSTTIPASGGYYIGGIVYFVNNNQVGSYTFSRMYRDFGGSSGNRYARMYFSTQGTNSGDTFNLTDVFIEFVCTSTASPYTYTFNGYYRYDSNNNLVTLDYIYFYASSVGGQANAFVKGLFTEISEPPSFDHTPDVLLNDIKTFHFNYSGLEFTQESANRTFTLYGYKVANAGDYTNQVGNCFVSVKYFTSGDDSITISVDQVMLNRLDDGYYLVLTCPDSIESIDVAFQGFSDWFTIEYDVYDYVGLFITNYENIRTIENDGRRIGYSTGYSNGYAAGTTEKNNLLSVMWSTFEMPFTLLFGYYDTDRNSLTYGQYVGGLFNFTILGLDVRAFVLGLMSLIILVGIAKFITGKTV